MIRCDLDSNSNTVYRAGIPAVKIVGAGEPVAIGGCNEFRAVVRKRLENYFYCWQPSLINFIMSLGELQKKGAQATLTEGGSEKPRCNKEPTP
jgi:hypothetical protein